MTNTDKTLHSPLSILLCLLVSVVLKKWNSVVKTFYSRSVHEDISLCQSLANEGTDLNMLGEKEFSGGKFLFGLMKAAFH